MQRDSAVCDFLAVVRIASTDQIARAHFSASSSPIKRASECLVGLSERKLVEGEMTGFGRPKVWRLTKRARVERGLTWRPPVLFSRKTIHWLAISDCYLELCKIEMPLLWHPEYREPIENDYIFAPDVWMVWMKRPIFLEVQLSDLSGNGWKHKWQVYQRYYERLHKRQIQPPHPARPVKPVIVAFSHQQNTTIGSPLGIQVIRWSQLVSSHTKIIQ